MVICFHGTDKVTVKRILKDGFRKGTYFARHLEDALEFGGRFVFFVRFEENGFTNLEGKNWWQFHLAEVVLPEKIWKVVEYSQLLILDNPKVVEGLI